MKKSVKLLVITAIAAAALSACSKAPAKTQPLLTKETIPLVSLSLQSTVLLITAGKALSRA